MSFIVEIGIDAGELGNQLSQMRTWLDHRKLQETAFRQRPGTDIWRVDFAEETAATAFARAFVGQVLKRTAT